MKRRITLYIGSTPVKADLDDGSFVLYNWSNGDLTEPAQIKNSWSRQITLPGTPSNDTIFGLMGRQDRDTVYGPSGGTGIYFDPSVRTPFQIFEEGGELLDRGYLKLDEVVQEGTVHSYKATLYGGLGGFLYNLAYDAGGKRRTLADLVYKDRDGNVQDLTFNISAATVKEAWDFLAANSGPHYLQNNKWDFINFAPAYNGFPSGSFSADKAVVNAAQYGIPASVDGYVPYNGGSDVLVSFTGKKTEWEARDLRSYLQRPVLRLGAFLNAIADAENNGGYAVELDENVFDPVLVANAYVWRTWLTLPLLTTLDIHQEAYEDTFSVAVGMNTIPDSSGAEATYTIEVVPRIGAGSGNRYLYADDHAVWINWIELTAQYYNTANVLVKTETFRFGPAYYDPFRGEITHHGYFDAAGNWVGEKVVMKWTNPAGIGNELYGKVSLTFTNGGIGFENNPSPRPGYVWTDPSDDSTDVAYTNSPVMSGEYNAAPVDAARSFIDINATDLLNTDNTPADYLLSFCKMLGLRLVFDPAQDKVTITSRYGYFNDRSVYEDLTARINRGKPITTVPLAYDKRWYNFALDYSKGAWAKYYENVRGVVYGSQRVDTGFEFDAGTNDVMAGVVFKGAVQILESSKYYCRGYNGITPLPGVFFDSGSTYQMFKLDDAKSFDLPYPAQVYDYANRDGYPYHDVNDKPQFHGEENAPYDERDTLLFFDTMDGRVSGQGYRLTDDSASMMTLNKNTPCWDLSGGTTLTEIPHFSRYCENVSGQYSSSLDFGVPAEIPIPNIQMKDWASIYTSSWKRFIEDRLDTNTRVVRCFVNLDGLMVGQDLLRRFFHFDGAIWSLNKIINYSLTTWDDTECEFVKVQDVNNYQ